MRQRGGLGEAKTDILSLLVFSQVQGTVYGAFIVGSHYGTGDKTMTPGRRTCDSVFRVTTSQLSRESTLCMKP